MNQLERGQGTDIRGVRTQISRIEVRLRRVERDVVNATDTAASTGRGLSRVDDRLDQLSTRLSAVEDRQPGGR